MKQFSRLHPVVNFMYLVLVLVFSMVLMNPVCLVLSILFALVYALRLSENSKGKIFLFVPFILVFALFNPIFNHQGATILCYLPSGNPLTLESVVYGFASSFMLISVTLWFYCFNKIMTSDKLMYLFGRIMPSFSLIFSMILRFVPRFTQQLKKIISARKTLNKSMSKGIIGFAKEGMTVLSALTTYALENSLDISDSMRSRGYGLENRISFSIYSFSKRDICSALILSFLGIFVIGCKFLGFLDFWYFPAITQIRFNIFTLLAYGAYLSLCLYPLIFDCLEEYKWKATQLKI